MPWPGEDGTRDGPEPAGRGDSSRPEPATNQAAAEPLAGAGAAHPQSPDRAADPPGRFLVGLPPEIAQDDRRPVLRRQPAPLVVDGLPLLGRRPTIAVT